MIALGRRVAASDKLALSCAVLDSSNNWLKKGPQRRERRYELQGIFSPPNATISISARSLKLNAAWPSCSAALEKGRPPADRLSSDACRDNGTSGEETETYPEVGESFRGLS